MKAGTMDKIKFKRLRQTLALPDWQLIGLLEAIWQATYANAPAGDIGRLTNADIATSIGWTDDADVLIDALVASRWLDADPTYRLLVHDWEVHCASWLRANFKRHGKEFAKPTSVASQQLHGSYVVVAVDTATKLPPSLTKPNHTKATSSSEADKGERSKHSAEDHFSKWWKYAPRKVEKIAAKKEYDAAIKRIAGRSADEGQGGEDAHEFLLARIQAFASSPIARGEKKYIPYPTAWLKKGRYDDDPEAWGEVEQTTSSRVATTDDLANFDLMTGAAR